MTFIEKILITTLSLTTLCSCSTTPPTTDDSYSIINLSQQPLPLSIQLPREDSPAIPFYASIPITYLRAPEEAQQQPLPPFYQVPVPSLDLVAPTDTQWNPNNDPSLYYELPSSITQEDTPTNKFPKKFNKEIHNKLKPLFPKKEVVLEPINELVYNLKQRDVEKKLEKLAKQENLKQIQGQQTVQV